jgi:putative pyruvate formate lyase activating enzyme
MDPKKLELVRKANSLLKGSMESCSICPRRCGANRSGQAKGYCRAGVNASVYSCAPHHGEEPPISGKRGSGTIFFSHCNMKCVYCQNCEFSQLDKGEEVTSAELSGIMLDLQGRGCHNINLVTPTHYVPQILEALEAAIEGGLEIPLVYNTSGYELTETIRMLDGIIDIYLPDMRYSDDAAARRYSDAVQYVGYNRSCIKEMQEQAGDLELGADGIARRGLIIRLLALPGGVSGTIDSMRFIRDEISPSAYLSIMSQYYPAFNALKYTEISRAVSVEEYKNIVDAAHLLGLNNGWTQEPPGELDSRFRGTNIKPMAVDDEGQIG